MLRISLISLMVSLSSGVYGFGAGAAPSFGWARGLFFLFLVLWLVSLIAGTVAQPPLYRRHPIQRAFQ